MAYSLLCVKGDTAADIQTRLADILNGFPIEDENQKDYPLTLSIVFSNRDDLVAKVEKAHNDIAVNQPINDPQGIYFELEPSVDKHQAITMAQEVMADLSLPIESVEDAHKLAKLASQGVPINVKLENISDVYLPPDLMEYDLPGLTSSPTEPAYEEKNTGIPPELPLHHTNTSVLKAYLDGNSDVLKSFFDLQEKALSKMTIVSDHKSYIRLIEKIMGDNQQLIKDFMAAQKSIVASIYENDADISLPEIEDWMTGDPVSREHLPEESTAPKTETMPKDKKANASVKEIETWVINEISEITGYPTETIHRDANFEDDMGLDSITLIQILLNLVKLYPELEQLGDHLREVKTLGDLSDLIDTMNSGETRADISKKTEPPDIQPHMSVNRENHQEDIERYVFFEEIADNGAVSFENILLPEKLILIGCRTPFFDYFQEGLRDSGVNVISVVYAYGKWELDDGDNRNIIDFHDLNGLTRFFQAYYQNNTIPETIFIADNDDDAFESGSSEDWIEQIEFAATGAFLIVKALAAQRPERKLKGNLFAVLSRQNHANPAWQAAIGIAKSMDKEWPQVNVRYAKIREPFNEIAIQRIMARLTSPQDKYELIIGQNGAHAVKYRKHPFAQEKAESSNFTLSKASNILVTGGGSGIAAEMGIALAEKYRCTIIALGRTPWPDHYTYMNIKDDNILKKRIFEDLNRNAHTQEGGTKVNAKDVKNIYNSVKRQQGLLDIQKRIQNSGGKFKYYRADVTSESDLAHVIDRIHHEIGPVNGLIHGAGLTNDYLVSGKTIHSFRQVVNTKAHSVFYLYHLVKNDPLSFVSLVSSISSIFGRQAQADYTAANEVLNAAASYWNSQVAYPVKAMLWSLWLDTGLASEALIMANQMLNLPGISSGLGQKLFLEELLFGDKAVDKVIFSSHSTLNHTKEADLETYSRLIEEGSRFIRENE